MVAHCLFEQSGTFKNEFIKLGIPAMDYDILNDFGETDHIVDLYGEIVGGYCGAPSIFDNIKSDDIVLAFFPCTRFSTRVPLNARGANQGQQNWDDLKKIEYSRKTIAELNHNYQLFCKLTAIALKKGFGLIVENPYAVSQGFLQTYYPIKPALVDKDRRDRGDQFKKPTQYFFYNIEPKHNFIFEPQIYIGKGKTIGEVRNQVERSMITPEYANRFIREFILNA